MLANARQTISKLTRYPLVRAVGIPTYRAVVAQIRWTKGPKIVAISMPKAGTHLLSRVLDFMPAVLFSGQHLSEEHIYPYSNGGPNSTRGELDLEALESCLTACRDGQYVTAHFPCTDEVLSAIEQNGFVPLLILRDPRDVAVSYVHYVCREPRHFHHEYYTRALNNFGERLDATLRGFEPDGVHTQRGLAPLSCTLESYVPWLDTDTAFFRFELLVGAEGGGCNDEQRAQIQRISATIDRELDEQQIDYIGKNLFATHARTFRKGQINDWVNVLEERHIEFCEAKLDHLIEKMGYQPTRIMVSQHHS